MTSARVATKTECDSSAGEQPERGTPDKGHSFFGGWLYAALWVVCRTLGITLFGFRVRFAQPLPQQGGLLVISSHQSHLDPLLLGLASDRRLSSLARSSLYRFKPFGAVITALDAIPIDRETSPLVAMKRVIRRLETGAAVLIVPEGTRTASGQLGDLKNGFSLLAKRAGVPIVPVAIVGAYECWPRWRWLPRPGRIRLEFGQLLSAADVARMSDREIVEECQIRLKQLDATARLVVQAGRSHQARIPNRRKTIKSAP